MHYEYMYIFKGRSQSLGFLKLFLSVPVEIGILNPRGKYILLCLHCYTGSKIISLGCHSPPGIIQGCSAHLPLIIHVWTVLPSLLVPLCVGPTF